MSTPTNCEDPNWSKQIFEESARVQSSFRGKDSPDVPARFKGSGTVIGREDFLVWAALPEISYSANPETLYNLKKLGKRLEKSDCFVKKSVDAQEKIGVTYPMSFYLGLVAGGAAVLYSLFGARK